IICINDHDSPEGNWPEAVNRLVVKVDKYVEKIDLTQLLACNFSTTTSNFLTASRIVLLDVLRHILVIPFGWVMEFQRLRLKIDEDFWRRIMNINVQYGSGGDAHSSITGWILGFFPYDREGTALHQNDSLEYEDFPFCIVEDPFKNSDTGHSLKFIAGFVGANQKNFNGESIVSD
ncbi:15912_t:CDS:2, partial [Cetraspora pellucida]